MPLTKWLLLAVAIGWPGVVVLIDFVLLRSRLSWAIWLIPALLVVLGEIWYLQGLKDELWVHYVGSTLHQSDRYPAFYRYPLELLPMLLLIGIPATVATVLAREEGALGNTKSKRRAIVLAIVSTIPAGFLGVIAAFGVCGVGCYM